MTRTLTEAQQQGDAPWTDPIVVTRYFQVFADGYPVTPGHLLFVPIREDWQCITECWQAAYRWGIDWMDQKYCEAFNLGQNVGTAAGQTVMYPHVHLIPRRTGDTPDPRGGVRHCVPGQGYYHDAE